MKPIQCPQNSISLPKAYQKGYIEFYKLRFKVTPDVLIPRPETELLVDEVLASLRGAKATKQSIILDLGTGAGNIAISIAKNSSKVTIIATDVSSKALKVAKQNAKLHGVLDKITFIKSNLLDVIPANAGILIVIVTNLPYIPSARIPYLDSSVKDFEPLLALDGGEDGFELYRKLFVQIRRKMGCTIFPQLIVCEIDYTQGELAIQEALKYFPNHQVEVKLDLTHKQRILKIT